MNKLEKIIAKSKAKGFESLYDECQFHTDEYDCRECSFFQVLGHDECCIPNFDAKTLLEPYEEPRKLTKRERAFCEYAQSGYIVRDKLDCLFWSTEKPYKHDECYVFSIGDKFSNLITDLFPFIKWEDEEPYSVEELLKCEVEE